MKRILLSLLTFCILLSCSKKKTLETEIFSMVLETELEVSIVESSLNEGYILFGTDTLKYKRGLQIDNLSEPCPKVIYMPIKDDKFIPPEGTFVTKKRNYDLDNYRFQNVVYKAVGDRNYKITYPRNNQGITGLFVDSLYKWNSSDLFGIAQFNLYGNIKDGNRSHVLKAFETIQFYAPTENN